jgi:hypothetical protein
MATIVRSPSNTYSSTDSGSGWIGDAATGHGVRSIVAVVDALDARPTPFLNSIKKGASVDTRKIEWATRARMPLSVTLGEAIDTSETAWDLATGHGDRLQKGDVLWIPVDASGNAEEIVIVSDDADGTDTRDVVRAMGGTTGVAHDTATVAQIIGVAMPENSDHPLAQYIFGDLFYNYPQRFAGKVQLDGRAIVHPTVEDPDGNVYERRLQEVAMDEKVKLERALIMGQRQAGATTSTTPGASSSMMSGLRHFTTLAGNTYDLGGALITMSDVETALYDRWTEIGDNLGDTIIASMLTVMLFDTQLNNRREFTASDTSVDTRILKWTNRLGTFNIVPSKWVPDGEIIGYNPSFCEYRPFEGLDWHFAKKEMGVETNGDYVIGSVSGDFTFVCEAIETTWRLYGANTTRSDYPTDVSI